MITIYKYNLIITDTQVIELPKNTHILCVQSQQNNPVLYCVVDTEETEVVLHTFNTYGTGHPIIPDINTQLYIGSYLVFDGSGVFHLFKEMM